MRCEDGLCWLVVDASSGGYKFTNGADWRADPWSRRFTYDEFGELSLVNADDAHIERFFAVGDAQNEPRTVRILVPEGPVTHVLYAEDGQNLFDPDAMWGGWRLRTAPRRPAHRRHRQHAGALRRVHPRSRSHRRLGRLVRRQRRCLRRLCAGHRSPVDPLRIRRARAGRAARQLPRRPDFVAHRRPLPGRVRLRRQHVGHARLGSIGAENDTIIQRYAAAGHRGTALYLDSGGSGSTCADRDGDGTNDDDLTASDNYCETVQLRDVLSDAGYTFDTDLWHWWEADAEHNEAYWAARVYRPLDIFVSL